MKKLLALFTTVMIAGVIIYGSGSLAALDTKYIQTAVKNGTVRIGMNNNVSFLTPMSVDVYINPTPVNIYTNSMCAGKSTYTQTVLDGYFTSTSHHMQ